MGLIGDFRDGEDARGARRYRPPNTGYRMSSSARNNIACGTGSPMAYSIR